MLQLGAAPGWGQFLGLAASGLLVAVVFAWCFEVVGACAPWLLIGDG